MDLQLRHCVGGKLLDKHGTVEPSRVTCPRDTTSVLEGRERSQPYLTRTSSRVDLYTTDLTLASEQHGLSPSRLTQLVELPGSSQGFSRPPRSSSLPEESLIFVVEQKRQTRSFCGSATARLSFRSQRPPCSSGVPGVPYPLSTATVPPQARTACPCDRLRCLSGQLRPQ